MWSVDFSADGQYLAASSDSPDAIVKVWRVAGDSMEEQYTLTGFSIRVLSADFSPDSTRLVTTGPGGHLALWDAATGDPIRSFSGHVGTVPRATFSPDGRTLASSSLDATLRLWEVDSGINILTLSTKIPPRELAFSQDAAYLYASSIGGEFRVYAVQLETLVSLAHERLTRWFTPDECLQYLHTDSCPEKPPGVR